MTRTRASKPSEALGALFRGLALLAGALGCAACGAGTPQTVQAVQSAAQPDVPSAAQAASPSGSSEPPPRRPDAVVVEPPPAMPTAVARAEARGVVALREPLGNDAVREVVTALLDAWQRESLDALVALLTADAGPLDARARGRGALIESWRQRLHQHEYGRLAGIELARPDRIERWDWDELGAPDAPARPPEMRAGELYVRVPLEVTRVAGDKLFDDFIVLLLRREPGGYKVAAYGEADAP